MPKRKQAKIPITIYLTPEQIKEIGRQLREQEQDWADSPEIVALLEEIAVDAEQEFADGKTITLEALKAELGV
jgi:hypothetical protein